MAHTSPPAIILLLGLWDDTSFSYLGPVQFGRLYDSTIVQFIVSIHMRVFSGSLPALVVTANTQRSTEKSNALRAHALLIQPN